MGLHVRLTTPSGREPRACKKIVAALSDPLIYLRYSPEPKDQSTKIVFIQVVRELREGTPVLPSKLDETFKFQDHNTTARFFHLDYQSGERDPYYNGDDIGMDSGKQGNAVGPAAVTPAQVLDNGPIPGPFIDVAFWNSAAMWDRPDYLEPDPEAGKDMRYEFRTAAFSAAGADAGTYYQYQDWTYAKEKGKKATVTLGTTGFDPGQDFKEAVNLWCKHHGFSLPTPPAPAVIPLQGGVRHVIVRGDSLATIAQAYYGDSNLWPIIYAANQAVIGPFPSLLTPGWALIIP